METTSPFHVHVLGNAEIEVSENGRQWRSVSVKELQAELHQLREKSGYFVAYSRSAPTGSNRKSIELILNTIINVKLPIRLVKSKGSLESLDDKIESEPDGEASYANCLLVTLAKGRHSSVSIQPGKAVPNLANLTEDPEELDWIHNLPFNYNELDAGLVMKILLRYADFRLSALITGVRFLRARLALSADESRFVCFRLYKTKSLDGSKQLKIELSDG
ncbi:MAG: hypothetical protein ACYSWP_05775 [Planctomycetota bacterium]|jgi:hypothetical protein